MGYKLRYRPPFGPVLHEAGARTFDEFCDEQRIRVMNGLRRPIVEDLEDHGAPVLTHPRARLNDHLIRGRLHLDTDVEVRG